jgi:ATP phosphoribosyltransferase
MSLTVALTKGRLLEGSQALFRRAGLPFPNGDGRRLVASEGELSFLFVKDVDVATYVEHGVADCGVVGRDVLLEAGSDVYEPLDLGFGRCRLALASMKERQLDLGRGGALRVATKYPRFTARWLRERGVSAEVVRLGGSVELAPVLGLADCIVDVVETGRTLEENGLVVVEEIAVSTARLIVNRASFHARREPVQRLLESLRGGLA